MYIFCNSNFLKLIIYRISGLITTPLTDKVRFMFLTSGGIELSINGAVILSHYISGFKEGWEKS